MRLILFAELKFRRALQFEKIRERNFYTARRDVPLLLTLPEAEVAFLPPFKCIKKCNQIAVKSFDLVMRKIWQIFKSRI